MNLSSAAVLCPRLSQLESSVATILNRHRNIRIKYLTSCLKCKFIKSQDSLNTTTAETSRGISLFN